MQTAIHPPNRFSITAISLAVLMATASGFTAAQQAAPPTQEAYAAEGPHYNARSLPTPDSSVTSEGPFGQDASAYTLTFSDEFDGPLNTAVWNTFRGNASATVINYGTQDGSLKIWPQRDENGSFFDRAIDTEGKFSQTYGFFEIQAKLPKGRGTWPAFWLYNQIDGRHPEIDIMEAYGGGGDPWTAVGADGVTVPIAYAATIWTHNNARAGTRKVETGDLSAEFHRYAMKWEPNKQTFYFDGQEVHSVNVSMSDPLYMMVDLFFGSASGSPDGSTPTGEGNALDVKYVKAWQFK